MSKIKVGRKQKKKKSKLNVENLLLKNIGNTCQMRMPLNQNNSRFASLNYQTPL